MNNKRTIERIATIALAAFLIAYFCYQVAYGKHGGSYQYNLGPFEGWNKTSSWIQLSPALMKHDTNDQRIEYNILNGSTWNIVNSTDGTTAKISFGSNAPDCSYVVGQLSGRDCTWVISFWNDALTLGYGPVKSTDLTFKTVSPNHIELQDSHGDTIRLMRVSTLHLVNANTDCSQTNLTQDERYTCGYNNGYQQAQTDWNLNRVEVSGCRNPTEHTLEYCDGYGIGYLHKWNTLSR